MVRLRVYRGLVARMCIVHDLLGEIVSKKIKINKAYLQINTDGGQSNRCEDKTIIFTNQSQREVGTYTYTHTLTDIQLTTMPGETGDIAPERGSAESAGLECPEGVRDKPSPALQGGEQ